MEIKEIVVKIFGGYWSHPKVRAPDNLEVDEQFQIEIDEMCKDEQAYLETKFAEYKNLGVILFDIIPYKDGDVKNIGVSEKIQSYPRSSAGN